MPGRTLTPSAPLIQGVTSPNVVVDPPNFYAATRRLKFPMRSLTAISGLGTVDTVQLRQTGIVAALEVRVQGTITFGGTIGTTTMSYEWPFNLIQEARLSANGQSNLLRCRGLTIRALEFITNPKIDDSGISKSFGGTAFTTGTLALSCDDWGTSGVNVLAPGTNVAAVGTFTVDLTFFMSVAADPVSLIGAVYAQSQATNLTLEIQWATQAQIVSALGGAATFASALNWGVTGVAYSIPNVNGNYLVPDLSMFHQVAETRFGGMAQGTNEPLLPGTGVGRKLMRVVHNVYSGAVPTPLALTSANFNTVGWAYGGSDVPEGYPAGQSLRAANVRLAGVDLGQLWGLGCWDFATQFALRDIVDEGATSDLRIQLGLVSAPTSGYAQIAQETLFAAPVGA
jgi:hypothetical protein